MTGSSWQRSMGACLCGRRPSEDQIVSSSMWRRGISSIGVTAGVVCHRTVVLCGHECDMDHVVVGKAGRTDERGPEQPQSVTADVRNMILSLPGGHSMPTCYRQNSRQEQSPQRRLS